MKGGKKEKRGCTPQVRRRPTWMPLHAALALDNRGCSPDGIAYEKLRVQVGRWQGLKPPGMLEAFVGRGPWSD